MLQIFKPDRAILFLALLLNVVASGILFRAVKLATSISFLSRALHTSNITGRRIYVSLNTFVHSANVSAFIYCFHFLVSTMINNIVIKYFRIDNNAMDFCKKNYYSKEIKDITFGRKWKVFSKDFGREGDRTSEKEWNKWKLSRTSKAM